jgi:hypothetical protein
VYLLGRSYRLQQEAEGEQIMSTLMGMSGCGIWVVYLALFLPLGVELLVHRDWAVNRKWSPELESRTLRESVCLNPYENSEEPGLEGRGGGPRS